MERMSKQTKRACDTPYKTMIGGQALIEGIMMLGPEKKAVVVRKPDGELAEQVEERVLIKDKHPILGVPFIRGVFNFCSSMANGVKALMYSASFVPEDEEEPEEPSKFEQWLDKHLGSEKAASALVGLLGHFTPLAMWLRNLLEGVVRIIIFVGYLILCAHMKDIHRVFQYHGAEHKTIFCYEHGLPLTVENVRKQPRHHPRCGTSFLFVVIVVSILLSSVVFSFVEVTNTFLRMGLHLLMLPVRAALGWSTERRFTKAAREETSCSGLGSPLPFPAFSFFCRAARGRVTEASPVCGVPS